MFIVRIAGQDVTDFIIGTPITIRHSSDFPFFSDTEISDVTFDIFSDEWEFDPLKKDNWFVQNWKRDDGDTNWNQTGLRCPVQMLGEDGVVMFNGVIIDITPDIEDGSATIQCTDVSYQLRETEMSLTDFGIHRYISVSDADKENVYALPPTAPPVHATTVRARHHNSDEENNELIRVDDLEFADRDACKRLPGKIRFVVLPNTPAIQTDRELPGNVSVSFKEPHRWVRLDAIAKKIVRAADIKLSEDRVGNSQPDNEINVDIPDFYFNTDNMEYASRGRVGWHVEHTRGDIEHETKTGAKPDKWSWTGFVRDFVVNPANGDAFFIYGHREFPKFSAIIHYDYAADEYRRYNCTIPNQSLWRIATTDFKKFFVLSTAFPTQDAGYEFGHNYNTATTISSQRDADKPRIILWDVDNPSNSGWSKVIDATGGQPPQLANYVNTLNDEGGGVHHWWADTRTFFGSIRNRIGYRYQKGTQFGVAFLDESGSISYARVATEAKSGLAGDFCVDEDGNTVYALTIVSNGHLKLHQMNLAVGSFLEVADIAFESPNLKVENNLSVSDCVYHNGYIYCVIQFERQANLIFPGASLIRLRINNPQMYETLINYDYYVSSASGPVVAGDKVYYFEGNTDLYGNRGPRSGLNTRQRCSGSLVEVSSGMPIYEGLSRVSGYQDPDEIGYDYGAHTGIIAPLRWDGEQLHMITGYGDLPKATAFSENLTEDYNAPGHLVDEPQEDLENWHWLTFGRKQRLYLEKIEVSERVSAWGLLKQLAQIAHSQIYFDGDTLYMRQRAVFEVILPGKITGYVYDEDTAGNVLPETDDSLINVIDADNYKVDDNVINVSAEPTFTQMYNQIRGNVRYTVRGSLPESADGREILADDENSITYIGRKPLDVEVSLLSHHQMWWARIIANRYIKQLSSVKYDIELQLTWLPKVRVGDIIRLDIRNPEFEVDGYSWKETHMTHVPASIVEAEHTIDVQGDNAWTTKVVARTLIPETPVGVVMTPLQPDDPAEPQALASDSEGVYLIDNASKTARYYSDQNTRVSEKDIDLKGSGGNFQDATLTPDHLVVLDRNTTYDEKGEITAVDNRIRFFPKDGSTEDSAIRLEQERTSEESAGDWRGIAYYDGKLYVMNVFGFIRTYMAEPDGAQDTSVSFDLNLCADWKAIEFSVDTDGVWLLTLVSNLPTVLGWDVFSNINSPISRRDSKDVEIKEGSKNWSGIAVSENNLFACQRTRGGFQTFKR